MRKGFFFRGTASPSADSSPPPNAGVEIVHTQGKWTLRANGVCIAMEGDKLRDPGIDDGDNPGHWTKAGLEQAAARLRSGN